MMRGRRGGTGGRAEGAGKRALERGGGGRGGGGGGGRGGGREGGKGGGGGNEEIEGGRERALHHQIFPS